MPTTCKPTTATAAAERKVTLGARASAGTKTFKVVVTVVVAMLNRKIRLNKTNKTKQTKIRIIDKSFDKIYF